MSILLELEDVWAQVPEVVPSKTLVVCDGASKGNPGPAGWAALAGDETLTGWLPWATNNEMETMALLQGLAACPARTEVLIWSDSAYLRNWLMGPRVPRVSNGHIVQMLRSIVAIAQALEFTPWHKEDAVPVIWDPARRVYRAQFVLVKGHADNDLHNMIDKLAAGQAKTAKFVLEGQF